MAHHKRRRPKHQRSGCLFCKPHKDERSVEEPVPVQRVMQDQREIRNTDWRAERTCAAEERLSEEIDMQLDRE